MNNTSFGDHCLEDSWVFHGVTWHDSFQWVTTLAAQGVGIPWQYDPGMMGETDQNPFRLWELMIFRAKKILISFVMRAGGGVGVGRRIELFCFWKLVNRICEPLEDTIDSKNDTKWAIKQTWHETKGRRLWVPIYLRSNSCSTFWPGNTWGYIIMVSKFLAPLAN